ncbi:hypothetical protein GCM10027599_24140 [Yimella radicis]
MPTPAAAHRSSERGHTVAFRLSKADRDELKRRAAECGVSVQAYLEWKALDRVAPRDLPPGPVHQRELPLTG